MKSRFKMASFNQQESQVIIIPPGVIYQTRSTKNSLYNFLGKTWYALSNDHILDSCTRGIPDPFLRSNDIDRLKENKRSQTLELLHGTTINGESVHSGGNGVLFRIFATAAR